MMKTKIKTKVKQKIDLGVAARRPFVQAFCYTKQGLILITGDIDSISNYCKENNIICHANVTTYFKNSPVSFWQVFGNEEITHFHTTRYNNKYPGMSPDIEPYLTDRMKWFIVMVDRRNNVIKKTHLIASFRHVPNRYIKQFDNIQKILDSNLKCDK